MLAIIIRNRRQSLIKKEVNVIDHGVNGTANGEVNGTAIATNVMIENDNYNFLSTDTAENTVYEVIVSSGKIESQVLISSLYLEPLQSSTNGEAIDSPYFELSTSIADDGTTLCDEGDSYGFPTNL